MCLFVVVCGCVLSRVVSVCMLWFVVVICICCVCVAVDIGHSFVVSKLFNYGCVCCGLCVFVDCRFGLMDAFNCLLMLFVVIVVCVMCCCLLVGCGCYCCLFCFCV